jgi:hypothetical protein
VSITVSKEPFILQTQLAQGSWQRILYQLRNAKRLVEVVVLGESHRTVKKSFETEMWVDGQKMPLNHFVQETIANVMLGFSKTLKGLDSAPKKIEVKIKRLAKPVDVDAHTYP